ncbi:MAG: LysM peptidoglycan-binding domain-containing protein [Methylocystaceae bacterium]
MLYVIRPGDTMFRVAQRNRTTIAALMKANLICNPRVAVTGDLILIPRPGVQLPRLGGGPYYVLLPGDSLECIANCTSTSVSNILRNNGIHNTRRLFPGAELLIGGARPDGDSLYLDWNNRPLNNQLTEEQRSIYYQETFSWQALGAKAVTPLLKLLPHDCPEVRYYSILSLGRLGIDQGSLSALETISDDRHRDNRKLARLAMDRIMLSRQGYRRTRLLIKGDRLIDDLNRISPAATPLVEGTGVTVLKWHIPDPGAQEYSNGGIMLYDYVQVVASGQKGFLVRRHGELNLI